MEGGKTYIEDANTDRNNACQAFERDGSAGKRLPDKSVIPGIHTVEGQRLLHVGL